MGLAVGLYPIHPNVIVHLKLSRGVLKPRTKFNITKPDGSILPTKEFEAFRVVEKEDGLYFRYMRSIIMPGLLSEPPNLSSLKCYGTFEQIGPGVLEADQADYPLDLAWDIRKAISAAPGQ